MYKMIYYENIKYKMNNNEYFLDILKSFDML